MDYKPLMDWATLGIATVGAVLGIANTWRQIAAERVRLRVRMRVTVFKFDRPDIEVANLSAFPVTVVRAGWMTSKRRWFRRRWTYVTPADVHVNGTSLWTSPIRIEPREIGVISFTHASSHAAVVENRRVFVVTACGVTSCSPVMRLPRSEDPLHILGRPNAANPSPHQ